VSTPAATAGALAAGGLGQTPSALALARFVRHRPAVVSVALIVLLGIGTIFAGRLSPRDPIYIDLTHKFARPLTGGHLLGADEPDDPGRHGFALAGARARGNHHRPQWGGDHRRLFRGRRGKTKQPR